MDISKLEIKIADLPEMMDVCNHLSACLIQNAELRSSLLALDECLPYIMPGTLDENETVKEMRRILDRDHKLFIADSEVRR